MVASPAMERIRAIVKRWQRFAKVGMSACSKGSACPGSLDTNQGENVSVPKDFVTVYVGKTKRRYIISSQNLNHPLLRILIERSEEEDHDYIGGYSVACEVVLFDHLLWMLKNEDPLLTQSDSLEELVEFYAY